MSPRSLLFSSDQETSRQLTQVLSEWELGVESCTEIFAALKTLTSRSFQVVVIDWEEGLEASFLLKTARELKSSQNAFIVVIGKAGARAALEEAGAHLVLNKPITLDQMRHTLLTSDIFLSHLKNWLPHFQSLYATLHGIALLNPPAVAPPATRRQFTTPASSRLAPDFANAHPAFATLESGFLQESVFQRIFQPRLLKGSVLLSAALGVAFFALGYVFSQPLTEAGAMVARAAWGGNPSQERMDSYGTNDALYTAASHPAPAAGKIRVTPIRERQLQYKNPVVVSREPAAQSPSSEQPQTVTLSARKVQVPESIGSPFPGITSTKDVAAKVTPGLMDALQPVSIPDSLSEKLLLDKIEPSYPVKALQAGLRGPVVLQAWIGKDGKIRDLKLIRGPLLLGQAAFDTVKKWRYKPYLLNGEAVEAQTLVTVDFKLP